MLKTFMSVRKVIGAQPNCRVVEINSCARIGLQHSEQ